MSRPPASARPPAASPPRDQKAECRHCGPRKLTTTSSSSSSPSVEEGRGREGGRQSGANRPPRKKGGFLNGARRVRGQAFLACLANAASSVLPVSRHAAVCVRARWIVLFPLQSTLQADGVSNKTKALRVSFQIKFPPQPNFFAINSFVHSIPRRNTLLPPRQTDPLALARSPAIRLIQHGPSRFMSSPSLPPSLPLSFS